MQNECSRGSRLPTGISKCQISQILRFLKAPGSEKFGEAGFYWTSYYDGRKVHLSVIVRVFATPPL